MPPDGSDAVLPVTGVLKTRPACGRGRQKVLAGVGFAPVHLAAAGDQFYVSEE